MMRPCDRIDVLAPAAANIKPTDPGHVSAAGVGAGDAGEVVGQCHLRTTKPHIVINFPYPTSMDLREADTIQRSMVPPTPEDLAV